MSDFSFYYHQHAKIDFLDSKNWYENKVLGLGDRFEDELKNKLNWIIENPYMYQKVYRSLRAATLQVFPYSIYYEVGKNSSKILVLAILHHKRSKQNLKRGIK